MLVVEFEGADRKRVAVRHKHIVKLLSGVAFYDPFPNLPLDCFGLAGQPRTGLTALWLGPWCKRFERFF